MSLDGHGLLEWIKKKRKMHRHGQESETFTSTTKGVPRQKNKAVPKTEVTRKMVRRPKDRTDSKPTAERTPEEGIATRMHQNIPTKN